MSIFALLAPVVLIAAMLVLLAYARREFRPKPRADRDLVTHLGMSDPTAWTSRKHSGSTHPPDGAMDGGDGATGGDGAVGGGDGD